MFFKMLNDKEVDLCLNGITKNTFESGDNTQPENEIKQNKESFNIPDKIRKLITDKLYDNYFCDSVYCPTRVSVNFYNEYKTNDFFRLHIDEFKARPKSKNIYFDYGWSINLSDDYEGGQLIIHTPVGKVGKKLCAGEIAIFPIIYPHEVAHITKGTRKNIVGWLSSNISYEQAYILDRLYSVSVYCTNIEKPSNYAINTSINLIQNYLKKSWGKDQ